MLSTIHKRVEVTRDVDAIEVPSGKLTKLLAGAEVYVIQNLGGTYTVRSAYGEMARLDAEDADALGFTPPPKPDLSLLPTEFSEELAYKELRTCYDPEIPVNIVELGLIYGVQVDDLEDGTKHLTVRLTLTAPGCGMGDVLRQDVERKLRRIPGVGRVSVELVMDPPWDPSKMSEEARLELGFL